MDSIYILLAFFLGWFLAQSAKIIITLIVGRKKISFLELVDLAMKSGGMPSSHTASFVAATIVIGMRSGFESGLFALAVATTVIIVYDAVNVRFAVGQQGKMLNKIISNSESQLAKPIKIVEGHTIPQAIVGFFVGVVAAFLTQYIASLQIF